MGPWSDMANRILILTEGSVDEQDVFFSAFNKYGINTSVSSERIVEIDAVKFVESSYSGGNTTIFIIQGPRNRIHGFLKFVDDKNMSIEKMFGFQFGYFSKIFLIYDVDHNDCDDVLRMSSLFKDETTGMLLLSSPCIEVLADFNRDRKEFRCQRLREYKKEINEHYHGSAKKFIADYFDEIMLHFLEKNYRDFKERNIMEHPNLIVGKINELNIRVNCKDKSASYVLCRYFSTVVYVAIADALSLTVQVDNYETVKSFFESQLKRNN